MTASDPKPRLGGMSTALALAIVALPISLAAFAVLYANNDSLWAADWLWIALPGLLVAIAVLTIRDVFKGRSRRQVIGIVVLLVPTVFLVAASGSNRFVFHQLFTFRRLELFSQSDPRGWSAKFTVCAERTPCSPRDGVIQNRTFKLSRAPKEPCGLWVINGTNGKHRADRIQIVLNGKDVQFKEEKLPRGEAILIADVDLSIENTIGVQLNGEPDAYVLVVVSYEGRKVAVPA